jgi:hypothetical protein
MERQRAIFMCHFQGAFHVFRSRKTRGSPAGAVVRNSSDQIRAWNPAATRRIAPVVWRMGGERGVAFRGGGVKAEATPLPIMAWRRSLRFRIVEEK